MNYFLFADGLISFFVNIMARRGCVDAIIFRRNKRQFRQFIKDTSITRHILCLYTPSMSYAPRNMRRFQVVRMLNLLTVFSSIVLYIALPDIRGTAITYIFFFKLFLVHIPFFLYILYMIIQAPTGLKVIDFSIFKHP